MDPADPATDAAPPIQAWPPVSVIMPVLNEEPYVRQAVDRVLAGGYPGDLELVLAVGSSRDATESIVAELVAEHPQVVAVANPTGRTPQALNAALAATRHAIVVRVDAHGFLPRDYVRDVVTLLERTGAANVGGQMVPRGEGPFEEAVARAMSSRLGIGGAPFHVGGRAGPADSVYLGTFRRDVLERLGGFDEEFSRAQDWELNHRIRQDGGIVWFDPSLQVVYRPRRTVRALARQFYGSGQWRREVARRHRGTLSARYLAPPAVVAVIAVGSAAGVVGLLTGIGGLRMGWVAPIGYGLGVVVASVVDGRELSVAARLRLPAVMSCMHLSWGAGFLRGI